MNTLLKNKMVSLVGLFTMRRPTRLKVTVTDNAGQLEAAVEYPDGQEITNTYQAGSVTKVLKATKALTGAKLVDDQFTLNWLIKLLAKVVQSAKNKADGTVTFPAETCNSQQ